MIRIVLDTNVIVSALLKRQGLEAGVLRLIFSRHLALYLSASVLAEYAEVLRRPKFAFQSSRVEHVLTRIRGVATVVELLAKISACRDEADNRFLECAEAAEADFLVTGNVRHFPARWKTTRVVTARQLSEMIALDLDG